MKLNSHIILYGIVIVIILYLILAGTIRFKMQFWHTQPVFHIYNVKYWLNPPGFINKEPPPVNKFVNLVNNELVPVVAAVADNNTQSMKLKQICNFIRDNYVIHPQARYTPSSEDIMAYLESTNHPSFFNVYQEPRMLFDAGAGTGTGTGIVVDQEIIGITSIHALNVSLFRGKNCDKKKRKKTSFAAYYVDHLCVKPAHRKKGIPPQMIQTFYYNMARANRKVNAYMFKREGTLTAIVPLVCFDTHRFDIQGNIRVDTVLGSAFTLMDIHSPQLNLFVSFIKEQRSAFDCVIMPDVSSLLNLVKLEKLIICGILFNGELCAVYIFRPIELYMGVGGGKTVECIAAVKLATLANDVFITGFTMSLFKVVAKCGAATLLVEETAHSSPIIVDLKKNTITITYKYHTPTAFFLYNYACYSVRKEKALLVY